MGKARKHWHRKWRWQRVTQVMARDGQNCAICLEPLDRRIRDPHHPLYITFDHILPRKYGGNDVINNIRLAHRECNERRGCDPILPEDEVPDSTEAA